MIIPCLHLRKGTLVDPSNGKNVQDLTACLDIISLCPEFAIVYLDKLKETKEFGTKLVHTTSSSCVEYEADSTEEVLDLLDIGANHVVLGKEHLDGFGQFVPKERTVCKLTGAAIEELCDEINNLKERSSTFLLPYGRDSQVDEPSLVEFAKELKSSLCDNVRLILSVDHVISYSTISQLHSLGVPIQMNATWLLNELSLGQIIASCLRSDRPDGLIPTLVVSNDFPLGVHPHMGYGFCPYRVCTFTWFFPKQDLNLSQAGYAYKA